jgi:hypothetical protein
MTQSASRESSRDLSQESNQEANQESSRSSRASSREQSSQRYQFDHEFESTQRNQFDHESDNQINDLNIIKSLYDQTHLINANNLNKYILKFFMKYDEEDIEDYDLWIMINDELFFIILKWWSFITSNVWWTIHSYCYTHDFWLNHSESKETRALIMYRAANANYNDQWIMKQIE